MSEVTSTTAEVSAPDKEAANFNQSEPTTASESNPATSRVGGFAKGLLQGIPTLIVLAMLCGLAWWGHHYGWSLPKFSELTGNVEEAGVLWCDEHGVAEAECISCNADLMPKGDLFGWCKEHGVHECVLHNPQASQLKDVPDISEEDLERAARAIAARPRTKNDSSCKMHLRRIQFPSIEAVDQAGIDINLVDRGPVIETIKTTGEVVFDPTRVAHLASRAEGTIWKVERNLGDKVKQGDVLAIVDAVEVGRLKSRLLQLITQLKMHADTYKRLSRLGGSVVPGKQILIAKTAQSESELEIESTIQALSNLGLSINSRDLLGKPLDEAREALKLLGLPKSVLDSLDPSQLSSNLIPIVASRDGVVVMRDAVAGEVIETNKPLFTIADASQMWLLLNVRLEEAERIAIGQKIIFQPDGATESSTGKVVWISTKVDGQTRTVQVRGELTNENGQLRDETFGAGEVVLREEPDAIVVPADAVHWEGCCHIAFVRDKNYFKKDSYKVFHTRSVRPGATMGDNVEVIAGLLPGEVVVTKGSGILRAELLKGNLGAG